MRRSNIVVVGGTTALVIIVIATLNFAYSGFNPNARTSSLDTAATCSSALTVCPAFRIESSDLSVRQVGDVTSQSLEVKVMVEGASSLGTVSAYFENVWIGNVTGLTVPPGANYTLDFAIPTSMALNPGDTYSFLLEGVFVSNQAVVGTDWQSSEATAHQ